MNNGSLSSQIKFIVVDDTGSIMDWLFTQCNIWGYLTISLVMIVRICVLYITIIIKSELWIISHNFWRCHETIMCVACLAMFLFHTICPLDLQSFLLSVSSAIGDTKEFATQNRRIYVLKYFGLQSWYGAHHLFDTWCWRPHPISALRRQCSVAWWCGYTKIQSITFQKKRLWNMSVWEVLEVHLSHGKSIYSLINT